MINCEQPDCNWTGFTSELAEHEYEVHGFGTWGGPDCDKCGDQGSIVDRHDPEFERVCPGCGGQT